MRAHDHGKKLRALASLFCDRQVIMASYGVADPFAVYERYMRMSTVR